MENKGKNSITDLGKAIKIAAIQKDLKLAQVAKMAGTSYCILYQIMHGVRPGHKHVRKLAEILEIDISGYVA